MVGQQSQFAGVSENLAGIIFRSQSEPFSGDTTNWLRTNKGFQAGQQQEISRRCGDMGFPLSFLWFADRLVCVYSVSDDYQSSQALVGIKNYGLDKGVSSLVSL